MPASEVWLSPNRRVYWFGLIAAAVFAGVMLVLVGLAVAWDWWWLRIIASALAVVAGWFIGTQVMAMRRPRMAYGSDQLWVYLDPKQPTSVPIEIVECFFLGQGPSFLPKVQGKEPETQNIIVRLAESATDWKHRDLPDDRLGHWCEGYITLRGAWCEPITRERMQELNRRLAEVHRERKAAAIAKTASQEQTST